jgi:hypothetical protein
MGSGVGVRTDKRNEQTEVRVKFVDIGEVMFDVLDDEVVTVDHTQMS